MVANGEDDGRTKAPSSTQTWDPFPGVQHVTRHRPRSLTWPRRRHLDGVSREGPLTPATWSSGRTVIYMDPVAAPDEPDGPGWFVHTELVLPLRLRRWSGSPNGQKKNHQRRLWARDGHGERIGYVLNERYVYLLPGWEPLRPDVSDALLRAGVTLVAPSAAEPGSAEVLL